MGRLQDDLWDDLLETLEASNFKHFVYVYLVRESARISAKVREFNILL